MRVLAGWLYFLGGVALLGGVIIYLSNIPNVPDRDELVEFSGFLVAVQLEPDIDGTYVVYLKFRDHPRRYKYMSTYPLYVEVRDRLGIYRDVDLLVPADAVEGEGPPARIWALTEHDPYNEGTQVTYEDIYLETTETDRSWQNVGIYTTVAGLVGLALAWGIRKAVPYRPRDPSA